MHPKSDPQACIQDDCKVRSQERVCQNRQFHHGTSESVRFNCERWSSNVRACEHVRVRFGSRTWAGWFFPRFLSGFSTIPKRSSTLANREIRSKTQYRLFDTHTVSKWTRIDTAGPAQSLIYSYEGSHDIVVYLQEQSFVNSLVVHSWTVNMRGP